MIPSIEIGPFIEQSLTGEDCIFDVRSPSEYAHAHFPGAYNLPLLNDDERKIVGTTFKEKGKDEAVRIGFELTGHKFSSYIESARKISGNKKIILYCWRGGMRSHVMGWLLNLSGMDVRVLEGGYKKFRNWVLDQLVKEKNIWIIGGKTGAGKSEVLNSLKNFDQQIIDLEVLACHKGSTFGALGQSPQPTMEQFENNLAYEWSQVDPSRPLWVEDESRWVGKVKIPDGIYDQMVHNNQFIFLDRSPELRKKRILAEYGSFPVSILAERTSMLERRLGGQRVKEALAFLEENNFDGWVDVMLDYYDRTYAHSNARRKITPRSFVNLNDHYSAEEIARRLCEIALEHSTPAESKSDF